MRISTQSFYEQSQAAMSAQQSSLLRTDPNFGKGFTISVAGGNYTVATTDTPPVTVASAAYSPTGTPIQFGGLQITLRGLPPLATPLMSALLKMPGPTCLTR